MTRKWSFFPILPWVFALWQILSDSLQQRAVCGDHWRRLLNDWAPQLGNGKSWKIKTGLLNWMGKGRNVFGPERSFLALAGDRCRKGWHWKSKTLFNYSTQDWKLQEKARFVWVEKGTSRAFLLVCMFILQYGRRWLWRTRVSCAWQREWRVQYILR